MVENGYVVYGGRSFVNLIYESSELAVPRGVIPLMQIQLATWSDCYSDTVDADEADDWWISSIRFVRLSDVIYTSAGEPSLNGPEDSTNITNADLISGG